MIRLVYKDEILSKSPIYILVMRQQIDINRKFKVFDIKTAILEISDLIAF